MIPWMHFVYNVKLPYGAQNIIEGLCDMCCLSLAMLCGFCVLVSGHIVLNWELKNTFMDNELFMTNSRDVVSILFV